MSSRWSTEERHGRSRWERSRKLLDLLSDKVWHCWSYPCTKKEIYGLPNQKGMRARRIYASKLVGSQSPRKRKHTQLDLVGHCFAKMQTHKGYLIKIQYKLDAGARGKKGEEN